MGNTKSSQESPETQSIIGHSQHGYHTHNAGGSGQHFYTKEAKILSNNLNRLVQQDDKDVLGVDKSEGSTVPNQGSDKKDLRIGFDWKDTSAPLAVTIDSISMLQ